MDIVAKRETAIPEWDLICYACGTSARRPVTSVRREPDSDAYPIFMLQLCDDCVEKLIITLIATRMASKK